jgi:acyl carrier protein
MGGQQPAMAPVIDAIYKALEDLNRQRPAHDQLALSPDTLLVGSEAQLDSLGLVNLIVAVEQHVADLLGAEIVLSEDRTLAAADTVMANVTALVGHVEMLIQEVQEHGADR